MGSDDPRETYLDQLKELDVLSRKISRATEDPALHGTLKGLARKLARIVSSLEQVEEALKQSEASYRQLFENAPAGIYRVDFRSGKFVQVNDVFLGYCGYTHEEITSLSPYELLTEESRKLFLERLEKMARGEEVPVTVEYEIVGKNGRKWWVHLNNRMIYDAQGRIVASDVVAHDITERRRSEETLRESEEKYRELTESTHDVILTVDFDFSITYANRAAVTIADGVDLVGMNLLDFTSPDMHEFQKELMEKRREGFNDMLAFEWEITLPGGVVRTFDVRATLLTSDGKPSGVMFVGRDTTERKRAEDALRLMQFAMDRAPESILLVDDQGYMTYANNAACTSMGYSRDELSRMKVFDIDPDFPVDGWEQHKINLKSLGKMTFEGRHRTKDGRLFPVEVTTNHVEYGDRFLAIAFDRDITERKQAEEALRASEERFRSIVSTSQEWIWTMDTGGLHTFSNPAVENILGYRPDEILGGPVLPSLIHEEDLPKVREHLERCIRQKTGWTNIVIRWRHKDGTYRYLESSAMPIINKSGDLMGFQGSDRDITERMHAEDALRKSEEWYRTIFESTATANIIVADDTTVLMANENFARLCGYSKDEMEGKMSWTAFIHEDDLQKMLERHRMRRLDAGSVPFSYEFRAVDRKGEVLDLFMSAAVIPGTKASIISMMDLTERKRLETQLVQAQKMESVGRLAGGVAHDFNNMLSVIMGNAELALGMIDPAEPLHTTLKDILNAGERSADLTRQLLAFARKQAIAPKVLDLNDTVAGMLKMLQRLIGEHITLTWMPGQKLWSVMIDPSQVDQLLANLTVNARDAIDGTGRIVIGTSNELCDEDFCEDRPECRPGEYVMLSVSDSGCGMDRETLANIFEPFFTTKKEGQGTGLGLATVYGIVRQNNGFIDVHSEQGKGTAFRIYLPRHRAEIKEPPDDGTLTTLRGGTETILIVEDEAAVLKLTRDMLGKLGYRVLASGRAEEAIQLAAEYGESIDLLLTDVIMPDMSGKELSERIRSITPGTKCLYMSGYTADVVTSQGILEEGVNLITKPFSLKDLAEKVRQTLG